MSRWPPSAVLIYSLDLTEVAFHTRSIGMVLSNRSSIPDQCPEPASLHPAHEAVGREQYEATEPIGERPPRRLPRFGRTAWLLAMPVLLTPPYVITNHLEWLPAYEVPRLAIDSWVPFVPEASFAYLGLFPLMWASVLVQPDAASARRLVLGAACCAWAASFIFLLVPTTFARPPGSAAGAYALITAVDTTRNACPSLHGTYAIYAAAWIGHALPRWWWRWLAAAAALIILAATIAVRQHGTIDLALGGLLGVAAFCWWRRAGSAGITRAADPPST